jgi:hypothetical protein
MEMLSTTIGRDSAKYLALALWEAVGTSGAFVTISTFKLCPEY